MAKTEIPDDKKDLFISEYIFPEASRVFDFKPLSISEAKKDSVVVLDTNVLLLPYLAKSESLEEIRKVYSFLIDKKRVFIPEQVAREFSKHRANKITEIFQYIKQKRSEISGINIQITQYHLLDDVDEYKKMMELRSSINKEIQELCKTIDNLASCIQNWNWNDPVSIMYSQLGFSNIVYGIQINKEGLKSELEKRYFYKVPPGYKDDSKPDDGIGDLLIWKSILELGKEKKKNIIFVSADEKPDWRHKVKEDVLYPRYELVDEFRRISEGKTFHLIRFSELLNLFDASDFAVSEIAEIENSLSFIEEQEFLNKLKEYEKQYADEYVGIKRFVISYLRDMYGYEPNNSYKTLNVLSNKGLIILYDVETDMGIVKAIRSI